MDDTIRRQTAIDSIMEEPSEARYPVFYAEKLKQLPPAQSEPDSEWRKKHYEAAYAQGFVDGCKSYERYERQLERKRGKWINDRGLYRCSCCNQLWAEWWTAAKPIERMNKEMPYCPMCGSYNGEESEDEK